MCQIFMPHATPAVQASTGFGAGPARPNPSMGSWRSMSFHTGLECELVALEDTGKEL